MQVKSQSNEVDIVGKKVVLIFKNGSRETIKVKSHSAKSIFSMADVEYKVEEIAAIESKDFDLLKTTGAGIGLVGVGLLTLALLWVIDGNGDSSSGTGGFFGPP